MNAPEKRGKVSKINRLKLCGDMGKDPKSACVGTELGLFLMPSGGVTKRQRRANGPGVGDVSLGVAWTGCTPRRYLARPSCRVVGIDGSAGCPVTQRAR